MKNNNNIDINLDKVSYTEFNYVCHSLGRTYKRKIKPTQPTVNGHEFDYNEIRHYIISVTSKEFPKGTEPENKKETMLQYAKRRDILDIWHAELTVFLSNNHSLIFTGNKAIAVNKAWKAKIYCKNKHE